MQTLKLGDITVDVILKKIKNVHLSVYPPNGRVRISAPVRMPMDAIRVFAASKIAWIRQQQKRIREQERESPREYVDGESHYLWGKRYLLNIVQGGGRARVELKYQTMVLCTPKKSALSRRAAVLDEWYRDHVRQASIPLIEKWEKKLNVRVKALLIRRMKTRWGSCNTRKHTIRLNTELAKKPIECLEHVVLHEMLHLLEPRHSQRFYALMEEHSPQWKVYRDRLNQLPVRHENWEY